MKEVKGVIKKKITLQKGTRKKKQKKKGRGSARVSFKDFVMLSKWLSSKN